MNNDILIVGATGTVGQELVRLLVADGLRPRVLVRPTSQVPSGFTDQVEPARGDLADRDSLRAALRGMNQVFLVSRDQPEQATLEGNLIDMAVESRVNKVIKSSAFAAGLEPPVGYGINHAAAEQKLIASGLDWAVLRPYVFMQNLFDVADVVRRNALLPLPFGAARVAFIDARDVALTAFHLLLGEHASAKVHVLTGPESLRLEDCANILSRALDRKISYRSPPLWLAGLIMRFQGVSAWDIAMRKQLFTMVREGGEAATTSAFEEICASAPRSFENFIADYLDRFRRT